MHLQNGKEVLAALENDKVCFATDNHLKVSGIKKEEIPDLARLLSRQHEQSSSSSLEHLELHLWNAGNLLRKNDIAPLVEALRHYCSKNLRSFVCDGTNFPQEYVLMEGLRDTAVHLETLSLFSVRGIPLSIMTEFILKFVAARSLQVLDFMDIYPNDDDAGEFFQAVTRRLPNLKVLKCDHWSSSLSPRGFERIRDMLRVHTSLEHLGLSARSAYSLKHVANGLVGNDTLTSLKINCLGWYVLTDSVHSFAHALKNNVTMMALDFTIAGQPYDPKFAPKSCKETMKEIHFYLALNRKGRKYLLCDTNITCADWIQAIANEQDPSIIFFFVRQNPCVYYLED